jgi:DNA polymerase III subunit delta'
MELGMWKTVGQSKIVDLLQRAMENGTLAHAYLLIGPPQVGKMTLAKDLAAALNCQAEKEKRPCWDCAACRKIAEDKHADVQIAGLNRTQDKEDTKERVEIGIDQIKDMLHSANLPPFEGTCRVYIIDETGNLSLDAANRLLKTLEEPPSGVVFILLTDNIGLIPKTVISRCQQLKLSRLKTSEIDSLLQARGEVEPEKLKLISRLSCGCPGWAIQACHSPGLFIERQNRFEQMLTIFKGDYNERFTFAAQLALQFGKKRETIYETMDTWVSWWRDILLVKTGCTGDITSIDFMSHLAEVAGAYSLVQIKAVIGDVREAIDQLKLNGNPRLVLEALMLNLPLLTKTPKGIGVNHA